VGFHVSNLKIAITVFWWHPSKWTLPLLTSSASPHLTLMSTSTSGGRGSLLGGGHAMLPFIFREENFFCQKTDTRLPDQKVKPPQTR
jgi:hypothetical protein